MENIFNKLKKLIDKCEESEDVPIAALIVDSENNIVSSAYNTRFKNKNIYGHAEINALNKLFKKIKIQNLSNYVIYSTLKPCKMCCGAIEQLKIKTVYYFLDSFDNDQNSDLINFIKVDNKNYHDYFQKKIKLFFKLLRQKNLM